MSVNIDNKVAALTELGKVLSSKKDERLEAAINQAYYANKWFTPENINNSIQGISEHFLDKGKLNDWLSNYDLVNKDPKAVGLIMAGNIPLVGFHDLLCVYVSGHQARVKYSSKDAVLIKLIVEILSEYDFEASSAIEFVERLSQYDAVIATGSNNTTRYFEEYFAHVPNIIRKNRNGIAVITGDETEEDILNLGKDIFTYFGLGCRNVSKMYVPRDYDFDFMLGILHDNYKQLVMHHKYKNNFDYNHALFMLNKDKFLMSGSLMIREADAIASRIASVHYEYYESLSELSKKLTDEREDIQCIVSGSKIAGHQVFDFGKAQEPSLTDYADGVDTLQFLTSLT